MSARVAVCSYRFTAIALFLFIASSAAIAQNNGNGWGKGGKPKSPPPDDVLYWDPSGSSADFTVMNWYDSTTGSSTLVQPTGSSVSTYDSLIFDDPNSNVHTKAAPTSMSVSRTLGISALTFNNDFNGTNTTTISNNTASNLTFHLSSGWTLTDNATSGTITFNKTTTGTFKFDLKGDGIISVASGATVVFDSSVVIENESGGVTGGITKTGTGTLVLSGANTYSGGTTISGGTLLANNTSSSTSATGSGAITVSSGGMLGGTGFINAGSSTITINSGGTLLGGDGSSTAGTLTFKSAVTMNTGSIIELALGSSLAHSTIAMSSSALSFATNQDFKFIELSGVTTGTYTGILTGISSQPTQSTLDSWKIDNTGWSGSFSWDNANGGEINVNLIAVPEPSTYAAATLACLTVAYSLRRRFIRQRTHS